MITMNYPTEKIGNVWAEKIVIQWILENWSRKLEYDIVEEDFTDDLYRNIFKLLVKNKWNENIVDWEIRKAWWMILEEWIELQAYIGSYITMNFDTCIDEVKKWSKKRRDEIKQEIVNDALWGDKEVRRFLVNYRDIDEITWGFYPNQLITIAARPWIWKTMIALNFIANQLQVWHKVAFFSLEMSTKEIYQRLYARFWELEVNKIKWSSKMYPWDDEKLNKAMEIVNEFENNLVIFDDKHWLWEIVNQIRLLHSKWMLDIVYIDYVGLIEVKAENRNLEISKITRVLKMLAMQLKIPIVILAQLSRAVEKRFWWDEPILSDLRDSWSIEQDSDVVLMLHREDEKCLKVLVRKNRNWPLWPCYLLILPRYMQIWDMSDEDKKFYMNTEW